jgi:outer membrane protein TolC
MKRPSPRLLGLVALAAALAGCVTAPVPERADRPWDPPADRASSTRVWDGLRERPSDPNRPLTLAELTDIALQNSAGTRKAWHDARAAAAQVDRAQGMFMPELTAVASASRAGVSASPDSFDSQTLRYGPGLQLNYLVINFGGGRDAAVEQALQTVNVANHAFNQAIQDVLLNVATAYFSQLSAQAGVDAAVTNVADAKLALEAAKARNTAGMGTELDVLQAQAAYDQSLYAEAAARGQLAVSRGAMALAVGLPADTRIQAVYPQQDMPGALASNYVHRLIDEGIAKRPDIAALRADLCARQAAIRVAHATSWPNLYLNANLNRNYFESFQGNANQGDHDWSYGAGINVQWNLFDGWQTESQIRTAEAQALSAAAALEQAELAASADVWTRFQTYETALQKYTFAGAYLRSATAARNLAAEAYAAGLKTVLDLLAADTQLAAARSQKVTAQQEVLTALAGLAHATGKLNTQATNPFAGNDQKENKP